MMDAASATAMSMVPDLQESGCHRFGTFAVLLRANTHPVQLARAGFELAQKCCVTLFPEVCRQFFGILFVREAAQLHGPHTGR